MERKSLLLLMSEAYFYTCDYYDLKLKKLFILKHHHSHAQLNVLLIKKIKGAVLSCSLVENSILL